MRVSFFYTITYPNMKENHKLETALSSSPSELESFIGRLKQVIGNISVRGFAHKIDISEGAIRKYLAGDSTPNLERLWLIAKAGGVSVCWLTTGEGEMRPGTHTEAPQTAPPCVAEPTATYENDGVLSKLVNAQEEIIRMKDGEIERLKIENERLKNAPLGVVEEKQEAA